MGTRDFLIIGETKKAAKNSIATELAAFKRYLNLRHEYNQIVKADRGKEIFTQSVMPDMAAEHNTAQSLFCDGQVRKSGETGLDGTWGKATDMIGNRCRDNGVAKELYTIGWPWYQMGLIAGWFDKPQHADYARIYSTVDLSHTVSFGSNVKVGQRSRGGGWHIDMAFDTEHENAAPLYFVSTDDHPTLFFKGKLADYLGENDHKNLDYIKSVMGEAGSSGTYQAPHSMYPVTDASEKNVPAWFLKDKLETLTMMYDIPLLAKEPPCQYMSGLINLKVFDAEIGSAVLDPESTANPICPTTEGDTKGVFQDHTTKDGVRITIVQGVEIGTCLRPYTVTYDRNNLKNNWKKTYTRPAR